MITAPRRQRGEISHRPREQGSRRRRWIIAAAIGALALLLALGVLVDGLVLNSRIRHVSLRFPAGGSGTTYVIAGSDSRASVPAGDGDPFGTAAQVPGERADAVILVHEYDGRVSVVSVPRDVLVSPSSGIFERLTLTLLAGPQDLVNGLCNTLGVAATHLVIVNFSSFASIVDAVGGVTVDLPYPVRDPMADLNLASAGRLRLNGLQALALVRSRNPQWLEKDRWVTVPDGAAQRTDWAARVLTAVIQSVHKKDHNPITLQRLAWDASGTLTTSTNTGLMDLVSLARLHTQATPLTASSIPDTLAVQPDAATKAELAAAGYSGHCQSR